MSCSTDVFLGNGCYPRADVFQVCLKKAENKIPDAENQRIKCFIKDYLGGSYCNGDGDEDGIVCLVKGFWFSKIVKRMKKWCWLIFIMKRSVRFN